MTNEAKVQLKPIMYHQISNILNLYLYEPWNTDVKNSIERSVYAVLKPFEEFNMIFNCSIATEFNMDTNIVTLTLKYKLNPDDENFREVEFKLGSLSDEFPETIV